MIDKNNIMPWGEAIVYVIDKNVTKYRNSFIMGSNQTGGAGLIHICHIQKKNLAGFIKTFHTNEINSRY